MDLLPVGLSLLSAVIVAAVAHVLSRYYLLAFEREKYRQALFGEKLKAYREISEAIHKFNVSFARLFPDLNRFIESGEKRPEGVEATFDLAGNIEIVLDRHIFFIPNKTVDRMTLRAQPQEPGPALKDPLSILRDLEVLHEGAFDLLNLLRDDLGIEEFAYKLEKRSVFSLVKAPLVRFFSWIKGLSR